MSEPINEVIVLEVTRVSQRTWYPKGYREPAEQVTLLELSYNGQYRKAEVTIAGNLPLGTRFKLTVEQVDTVDAATIHRGALPVIEDKGLLTGGDGGIQ